LLAAERLSDTEPGEERRALQALQVLATDGDAAVRRAAVSSMGYLGNEKARATLVERLEDDDARVREAAVIALSRIGGEEALEILRRAISSPHPEVRFQAAQSCAELCPRVAEKDIARLAGDDDARVRAGAVAALGSIKDRAFLAVLREALGDDDRGVRREAGIALAGMGEAEAVPALLEALDDAECAFDVLEAVAELKEPRCADPVASMARKLFVPLTVRTAAARTLVRLGDSRGVEILRSVLTAWRDDGRNYAVEVSGELRLTALAGELEKLARRPRGADPETLAVALSRLSPESEEAHRGLQALARRDDAAGELARKELDALGSGNRRPATR
jgi:HEAT repeat protein